MAGPFKMKGPSLYSSPMKQDKGKKKLKKDNELEFTEDNKIIEVKKPKVEEQKKIKEIKGTSIFGHTPKELVRKAAKPYTELYELGKKTVKTFLVDGPKDFLNLGKKK